MVLSLALCLRESLNQNDAANELESIVYSFIQSNKTTADLGGQYRTSEILNCLKKNIYKRRRKLWVKHCLIKYGKHVLHGKEGEPQLLYIDLHLIHEVTSPQAFEGLRIQNRKLRRPDLTFATLDHNVPTIDILI